GFDWEIGWRNDFLEVLNIQPNPDCPVCGTKGREKRNILAERMKKAEEAPISLEVNKDAATKEKNQDSEDSDKKKTVALLLNHDAGLAAGIIAALKSGKTYVPFDPAASRDSLSNMLEDSEARIILTDKNHLSLAKKLKNKVNKNIKVIDVGPLAEPGVPVEAPPRQTHHMEIAVDPGQKAYILYPPDDNTSPGFNESITELQQTLVKGNGPYVFNKNNDKQPQVDAGDMLPGQLRDYLLAELPVYMIPSY
ncbi:MAG: AMP-binding protein, partial [bacterium]|nr:AMP-binding protein [bacterium]